MEIILLKDVDKVGYKHDVVNVKNGFGRNYLIPQKAAIIANAANMKKLNELRDSEAAEEAKRVGFYQEIADKLKDVTLKIGAKAGTTGKIFGSVNNIQLIAALKDQFDIDIQRRKVVLNEDVKNLGEYTATLNLHAEVVQVLKFEVVAE